MRSELDLLAPRLLALSWLAAAAAYPLALIAAAAGQGFGALLGGCSWIGLSVPIDHQVWALVNQPVLNFASLPIAAGYWLGSLFLPLAVAVFLVPFMPRGRSLTAELTVVQMAWAASTVGVAWLPVLDSEDGHLARWLALHGMPPAIAWITPVLAAGFALLPCLRLLELARRYRQHTGRGYRLAVVGAHLIVPSAAWAGAASLVHGYLILFGAVAVALVATAGLALAWFRYPPAFVHPMREPSPGDLLALATAAILAVALLWVGGRPLEGNKSAGLLWGKRTAFNNVREWIQPVTLFASPR